MARLNDKCKKGLSAADFQRYPVWVWDETNTCLCPIDEVSPDPADYGCDFFIKARFSASGLDFEGFLIGTSSFFAFGLFVGGREFLFNLNLPDLNEKTLVALYACMNTKPFPLFPLLYQSEVRLKGGGKITGEFAIK